MPQTIEQLSNAVRLAERELALANARLGSAREAYYSASIAADDAAENLHNAEQQLRLVGAVPLIGGE
jgi:hypothetical protein